MTLSHAALGGNIFPASPGAFHQPLQLAYCAGLFDGDGSVGISKQTQPGRKNPTYRLYLSLVQNCFLTVRHFESVLGFPACLVEVKRTTQHNRQVWDLRYDGRHSLGVLALLEPFLVRKAIEAQVAREFYSACDMGVLPGPRGLAPHIWAERERYYKKLKRLK